jgi:carnitine 3-dehydrogenase
MNEAKYLQVFGDATDRFMWLVGCDADYIATGGSYFTAETHIRHLDEIHAGARIHVETTCLSGAGKKMHVFNELYALKPSGGAASEQEKVLCATGEHILIHVSLETRRPSDPSAEIQRRIALIEEGHSALPRPEGAGRYVGAPR